MQNPLVIDVREACRAQKTGKGQWTYGFVSELLRRDHPLTVVTDDNVPAAWKKNGCVVVRIPGKGLRWHLRVLRWLRKHPGVTYVSPVSYIVPALVPSSVRCIPIVHDLIAFLGEPHDRKATFIEKITLPRAVRKSFRVCVISESTRKDLMVRYPHLLAKKVTPVFAGPMQPHPVRSQPDGKTILSIATLCPRKNQLRLIRAFASLPETLRKNHWLILGGGRGWHDQEIVDAARNTPNVEWRGYIDATTYESLLHTCEVFALPSLYEGFGMQILDALQRGIPILTSDRGSLRELADGAALIVDPENVESIAAGLEKLLTDESLRTKLREKGLQRAELYSWRRTVDLFLKSLS